MGRKKGKSKKAAGSSKPKPLEDPQADSQQDVARNKGSLASMPDHWLSTVASWLVQNKRTSMFKTCKANSELVLSHPDSSPSICLERPEAAQVSQHVLERAIAMAETYGSSVTLNLVSATGCKDVREGAVSSILTRARTLVGPDCQQLAAITKLTCGGAENHTWSFEGGLIPECLIRLCPNLQTLHLQHVCIDSLPEPALGGAALADLAKLESLHLEEFQLAESITAAMVAHQARRFPALTSLSMTGAQADIYLSTAVADLATALSQQLTYLKVAYTDDASDDWCSILFPDDTVYPELKELCLDVRCAVDSAAGLDNLHLALPALQRLYIYRLSTHHLAHFNTDWLVQLEAVSCSYMVVTAFNDNDDNDEEDGDDDSDDDEEEEEETPEGIIITKLEACGGVHVKPWQASPAVLLLTEQGAWNQVVMPYICTKADWLVVESHNDLFECDIEAIGADCQCTHVVFEPPLSDRALMNLPQLMPDVSSFCFQSCSSFESYALMAMCRTATRPVDFCVSGECKLQAAQWWADEVRRECPGSKVRVCWEDQEKITPC